MITVRNNERLREFPLGHVLVLPLTATGLLVALVALAGGTGALDGTSTSLLILGSLGCPFGQDRPRLAHR